MEQPSATSGKQKYQLEEGGSIPLPNKDLPIHRHLPELCLQAQDEDELPGQGLVVPHHGGPQGVLLYVIEDYACLFAILNAGKEMLIKRMNQLLFEPVRCRPIVFSTGLVIK